MHSKASVAFESPARGMDHCIACRHFLGGRCEIVSGVVQAGDWCNKFSKESMIQKNPSQTNKEQNDAAECARKEADARSNHPGAGIKEHALHVTSRTRGNSVEVTFGPNGGGLVPANPFASLAQEGYLHAHPEKLGADTLAEFDEATKGMKLPKRVKKSGK